MPTDKLNLPLITGNMSADVPRDMNALAEAVDDAAGTDLATLEADGMIPSSQMRPIPGLSTHMNDLIKHITYAEAAGAANTYTVTISPAPSQYTDGLAIAVKINADSTGAATLNVNNLGARPLRKANGNNALDLKRNGIYTFRYNSSTTAFILQGEGGNGNAQPDEVLKGRTFSNDYGDHTGTMDLSNLSPENVRRGVRIHNVTGTLYGDNITDLIVGNKVIINDQEPLTHNSDSGGSPLQTVKEFKMNRNGNIRIRFSARRVGSILGNSFSIYINNTKVSEDFIPPVSTTTYTFDAIGLNEGDTVQLRHIAPNGGAVVLESFQLMIGNDLPYVTKTIDAGGGFRP